MSHFTFSLPVPVDMDGGQTEEQNCEIFMGLDRQSNNPTDLDFFFSSPEPDASLAASSPFSSEADDSYYQHPFLPKPEHFDDNFL